VSSVSYFQRFAQKENHVTNNTLLVLRHLYRSSPAKFNLLLGALFEEEESIGLEFRQQVRGTDSVFDGLIAQQPLSIFIETKLDSALYTNQIERHFASIHNKKSVGEPAILVGLTKRGLDSDAIATLRNKANGIRFFSVTYAQLAAELLKLCADYEQELLEIVEDYREFLANEGLISDPDNRIVVFPCGTSRSENLKFGVYFEPSSRPAKCGCSFLGIYFDKRVSYLGRIEAIVVCGIEDGKRVFKPIGPDAITDAHRDLICQVIDSTPYYHLDNEPHRFYLVNGFFETSFRKQSPHGLQSHRYFDVSDYVIDLKPSPETSAKMLADALSDKYFL